MARVDVFGCVCVCNYMCLRTRASAVASVCVFLYFGALGFVLECLCRVIMHA